MKRILILTANPSNTKRLALDQEVRNIEEALERSQHRDQFSIRAKWAVQPKAMARAILDYQPQIIHFSGHGEGKDGILLEDETGKAKLVSSEALSDLFELFKDHLECVIFNACYSDQQANVICKHIDYVIGMNDEVGDRSAIEFAVGFYDGLGAGRAYEFSHKLGCQYIAMEGLQQAGVPILKKKKSLLGSTIRLGVNGSDTVEHDSPDKIVDWTEYYDFDQEPRKLASTETWERSLLPELKESREELAQGRSGLTLNLKGKIPLSGAFVIGTVFQETLGYTLQVEQWRAGKSALWHSDAAPSDLKFRLEQEQGHSGQNLAIALAISRKVWPDVERFYQHPDYDLDAVVYFEPDTEVGAGDRALSSEADAVALVSHAKQLVDQYRQSYQATTIHLLLVAPMGFAAFLGHRLRAIGEVITYEHQVTLPQKYVPSAKIYLN